jgi:hypothetical protein
MVHFPVVRCAERFLTVEASNSPRVCLFRSGEWAQLGLKQAKAARADGTFSGVAMRA